MAGAATITELVTPPIKIPEVVKPSPVSLSAPPENPAAILGIINEHPIPPGTPDGVLHMIADADLSKKAADSPVVSAESAVTDAKPAEHAPPVTDETKKPTAPQETAQPADTQKEKGQDETTTHPEQPADEQADKKKTDEKPQEPERSAEDAKKHEQMKKALQELGKELADAKDERATLAALALSMGDTPMADEFQEGTFRYILQGNKPETLTNETWYGLRDNLPTAKPDGLVEFKKFLVKEGIPPEIADHTDTISMIANLMHEKNHKGLKKNEYTGRAKRLQEELGWTINHKMPTTAQDLTEALGEDPTGARKSFFQGEIKKEKMDQQKVVLMERVKFMKGQLPTFFFVAMMGMSFFSQIAQEPQPQQ